MKRIWILVMVFFLVGCSNNEDVYTSEPIENVTLTVQELSDFTDNTLNYYDIEVTLDDEKDQLIGKETITYHYDETEALEALYLHVYPNAFKSSSHPSLFDQEVTKAMTQEGSIEIKNVLINGKTIEYSYEPIDTVLKLPFDLIPGEDYMIEMDFVIQVSSTTERFGSIQGIYNLGNWYPILAVYDDEGWNLDPYYDVGDPFYSEVANYDVTLTLPEGYIPSASGYLYQKEDKTYHFRADRMRDFAFVLSDKFLIKEKLVNDTLVYLYYPSSLSNHYWTDHALTFAEETLLLYEDFIGDYPYKSYSVVITTFPSGMEYPGLVMISDQYFYDFDITNLRQTIVHESVHQWFYSLIGDDEIDEGWIDEGLTTYFTMYFDQAVYKKAYYDRTLKYYRDRRNKYGIENITVLKSAKDYADWSEYGVAAYVTPALMYDEIYKTYGDEKLKTFVQSLYSNYVYGILRYEDLIETLKTVYGEEVMEIVDRYLK
ncbi:MAG: M1 family metallopeptidase [Clostridia bacterium]|nr:M1 family metallopeptidase [Clostridia bacterium]